VSSKENHSPKSVIINARIELFFEPHERDELPLGFEGEGTEVGELDDCEGDGVAVVEELDGNGPVVERTGGGGEVMFRKISSK
jgi:hypothetical protein